MFGFGSKKDKIDTKQVLANIKEKIESREKAASSFQDRIEMDQVESNDYNNSDSFKIFSEQVRKMYEKQTATNQEAADKSQEDLHAQKTRTDSTTMQHSEHSEMAEQTAKDATDFDNATTSTDLEQDNSIAGSTADNENNITNSASIAATANNDDQLAGSLDNIDRLTNDDNNVSLASRETSVGIQSLANLESATPISNLENHQTEHNLNATPEASSAVDDHLASKSLEQDDRIESTSTSMELDAATEIESNAINSLAAELPGSLEANTLANTTQTADSANLTDALQASLSATPVASAQLTEANELSAVVDEPNSKVDGLGMATATSSEDSIHQMVNTGITTDDFLDSQSAKLEQSDHSQLEQLDSAPNTINTQTDLGANSSALSSMESIANSEIAQEGSNNLQPNENSLSTVTNFDNSAELSPLATALSNATENQTAQESASNSLESSNSTLDNASTELENAEDSKSMAHISEETSMSQISSGNITAEDFNDNSISNAASNELDNSTVNQSTADSISTTSTAKSTATLTANTTIATTEPMVSTPDSAKDGLGSVQFTDHSLVTTTPTATATQTKTHPEYANSSATTETNSKNNNYSSETNNSTLEDKSGESSTTDSLIASSSDTLATASSTKLATENSSSTTLKSSAMSDTPIDTGSLTTDSNNQLTDSTATEQLTVEESNSNTQTESKQTISQNSTTTTPTATTAEEENGSIGSSELAINNSTDNSLSTTPVSSSSNSVDTKSTDVTELASKTSPSAKSTTSSSGTKNHYFDNNKNIEATMNSHHKVAANLDSLIDKTAEQKVERAFAKLVEVGNMDSVLNRYLVKQVPIMINEWLDENLPMLVTKYVKEMAPEFLSKQIRKTAPSLLTKWLNNNLPEMVEQLVAEEIQRISDQVMKKD